MIVETTNGTATLSEADDLKAFKLVHCGDRSSASVADALARTDAGVLDGDVAWIRRRWIEDETDACDDSWREGFAGMIAYARSRGWYDEDREAVRAHIEWGDAG